jgi:beta-lactamase class A
VRGLSLAYGHRRGIRALRNFPTITTSIIIAIFVGTSVIASDLFSTYSGRHVLPATASINQAPQVTPRQEISERSIITKAEIIQSILSEWAGDSEDISVSISSLEEDLASVNDDQSLNMASIYKIYVAYLGYLDIDAKIYNYDDTYIGDISRGKCLDIMIRNSDNPCGEKMLEEYGYSSILPRLHKLGIENTSISEHTTSSKDTNTLLKRIWKGSELTPESTERLLASMLGQKYRSGIPKGFDGMDVYNKVGFHGSKDNNDVAIVILPDGEPLFISVLSSNKVFKDISQLSEQLRTQFAY